MKQLILIISLTIIGISVQSQIKSENIVAITNNELDENESSKGIEQVDSEKSAKHSEPTVNKKNTALPVMYKITYISMDGEGYKPRNEYLKVTKQGDVYKIYYGGYSTFDLKYVKKISDNYYYESEEGLLSVSSKAKLSELRDGLISEGWLTISFECCLTEILRIEKMDM